MLKKWYGDKAQKICENGFQKRKSIAGRMVQKKYSWKDFTRLVWAGIWKVVKTMPANDNVAKVKDQLLEMMSFMR